MRRYGRYRFWALIALALIIIYAVCNNITSGAGPMLTGCIVHAVGLEALPVYGYVSSTDSEDDNTIARLADRISPVNEYARDHYVKRGMLSANTDEAMLTDDSGNDTNVTPTQDNRTGSTGEKAITESSPAASTELTPSGNKLSDNKLSGNTAATDSAATDSAATDSAATDNAATGSAVADSTVTGSTASDIAASDIAAAASANIITGTLYPRTSLNSYNYVLNNFYTVTGITELGSDKLRPSEFLQKDMTMLQDSSKPQILIFHTHSQEAFADSVEGDESGTIVGVGDYLTRLLSEKYGYNVIHDKSVYDLVNGKLDRSKAYTYAEQSVAAILEKNPSIEVVIDLHRDGVPDTTRLVTEVNGKKTARIMFFNGLSYSRVNGDISYLPNPYRDDNLALSLQMQLMGNAYYPGYLRRIYVNAYRYCLHMRGKSMLIEAGAQTNTVEEVKNAMEPLADILDKTLRGEKCW